jgi:hypothetical protein
MPANPNGFEHWRKGCAPVALAGKASSGTQEYWRKGVALSLLASIATVRTRVQAFFIG